MDLEKIIKDVEVIFPYDTINSLDLNEKYTSTYYKESNLGYKFFHSEEGSVHFAISEDGTFKKSDYLAQIILIESRIRNINKKDIKVLELGCGKGFNLEYLASRFENIHFTGIDITEEHLKQARDRTKTRNNVSVKYMSFDDFAFENEQFDLIYEIEAVCHTMDYERLIAKISDLLKKEGRFITFEGFRNTTGKKLTVDEEKLLNYVEKSMAVAKGIELSDWLETFKTTFSDTQYNDLSVKILPNAKRFNYLAGRYFKRPFLAKCINVFVPKKLVMNAIAGYLILFSLENKYHVYYHMEGVKSDA